MTRRFSIHVPRLCVLLLCFCAAGCSIPRDPEGTLARAQGSTLRVGVIDAPPWAMMHEEDAPEGVEAEFIKEFAAEIGARPEWVAGTEPELLEALKHRELDLVIGGLTTDTKWSAEVGLTNPFYEERSIISVPPGVAVPREIDGARVAVQSGSPLANEIEDQGATVVDFDDSAPASLPLAAPAWEAEQLGFTPTDIELHTDEHVIATAPGENALLVRLERFLFHRRERTRELLRRQP